MRNRMNLTNLAGALAFLAVLLLVGVERADAGRLLRNATAMKAQQPAAPAPVAPTAKAPSASAPAVAAKPSCAPAPVCCPAPCIRYIDRSCGPVCCNSAPPIKTVLKVVNPLTCCAVDVPVCLPSCCEGSPSVCARCGLILCRSAVTYDWCCGYRVVVRFDRCGNVTVVYRA